MSLSLAGDLIVATESARFTMAYTQIGASPDGSSTFFLPRLVGVKRALELTFLNRVLSAREAMEWGIVQQVFPDEQFQAGVQSLATRRCFKPVDLLPSRSQREPATRVREAMITQVLHCPYCQETDIVKHGLSSEGKQRYRCRACREGRGRTFLLEYTYAGQAPAVKQQIVDMALNASGIRDTARVLHVSPSTVIKELKKGTRPPAGESDSTEAPAPRA